MLPPLVANAPGRRLTREHSPGAEGLKDMADIRNRGDRLAASSKQAASRAPEVRTECALR